MDNRHNYCVILGGGVGSRFWPISRQAFPKQFLDFFGTGRTLLQQTFDRFRGIIPLENIFVISNEAYENIVKEQLPEIFPAQILLEPTRRSTAPCIAWAAYHIRAIDPEANIVVTPSDHLILKEREFLDSVSRSLQFVSRHKKLVTLGVKPNRVETRYGYIQIADDCEDGFYKVKTFTEKPEYELAKVFVESGEFYWNSGLFVWNVDTFIEAVKHLIPELYAKLAPGTGIYNTELEADFIRENFPYCPNISIDLGIMEKAGNVFVFLGDFGWSDLGTWSSLYDAYPKDKSGNAVLRGHSLLYESRNNTIIMPHDKLVVLQGLDDCLVADSGDVLLVCKKEDENAIRRFVNDTQIKLGDDYL